jgi:hypothetical protein
VLAAATPAFLDVATARAASAVTPRETLVLFNGRDLSNFYTWLAKLGRADPDRVCTVVDRIDGAPAIRMSGQHTGGIVTKERYKNYRLVVEYRWGLVTWGARMNRARAGAISLHCQGEDGNHAKDFTGAWMRSIEFFLAEGGAGDLILLGGYERGNPERIFPSATAALKAGTQIWDPTGTPTHLPRGRVRARGHDAQWQDVLGARSGSTVEKPTGEWNRIEAICAGDRITCFVNGVKVNEVTNASFTGGSIMFPSEGAEIYFRRIELHPLEK